MKILKIKNESETGDPVLGKDPDNHFWLEEDFKLLIEDGDEVEEYMGKLMLNKVPEGQTVPGVEENSSGIIRQVFRDLEREG